MNESISTKTVAFCTLGCKLNFAESSTLARLFKENGYQQVSSRNIADVYVVNTCAVTAKAERKCKTAIHQLIKKAPNAKILITGCWAELNPDKIEQIPGVSKVVGNNDKFNLIEFLQDINISDVNKNNFIMAWSEGDRSRSFLKIQDGCDYHCAYCTIPKARGKSRNAPISEILSAINKIKEQGIHEIVLTGVNIGHYGQTTHEKLEDLLKAIADKNYHDLRFRISSIEPDLLTDKIKQFVCTNNSFASHFHIPLQSGSDKILSLMRRRYVISEFVNQINSIKQLNVDCCIGVDIITGFPGETDELFEETYSLLKSLPVSYFHVFTFSPRLGTPAYSMPDKVDKKRMEFRSRKLIELSEEKRKIFYTQNCGKEKTVLVESKQVNGMLTGFTENYIKVEIPFNDALVGKLIKVKLIGESDSGNMIVDLK